VVTDYHGQEATSNTATITVNAVPSVTISPSKATLDVSQKQVFSSVVSNGTSPYYYQWYLNGTEISGATKATWTFGPTSTGSYAVYLNITDNAGVTTISSVSNVTVYHPSISVSKSGPASAYEGETITLNITVSNTGDCSLSDINVTDNVLGSIWMNGTLDSGATKTLAVNCTVPISHSSATSDTVTAVACDAQGVKVSKSASWAVTVLLLSIKISPGSAAFDLGQSRVLSSLVFNGTLPCNYQWYLNGTAIGGATNGSYSFAPSIRGHYNFYVDVKDGYGAVAVSNVANVAVNPVPSVAISPNSTVLDVGLSKAFTSSVHNGTSPYSYQWYWSNGTEVQGANSSAWTFSPTHPGSYSIYVNTTDSVGITVESNTATITVNPALSVNMSISPSSVIMDAGQTQLFTSNVSVSGGTPPYAYQWYLGHNPVSRARNSTWAFTPTPSGSYEVYLKLNDSVGAVAASNNVTVTVNGPVSVAISPGSAALDVGQSKTLASTISAGTSPYSYQWYLNGTAISGETSISYKFTPLFHGLYDFYVNVTDRMGVEAKSNTVTITVNPVPSVNISPSPVSLDAGQSQLFDSIVTNGTSPYTRQWYLNGTAIVNATDSSYNFTPSSRGHYNFYVSVTDSAGVTVESNIATVTVNTAPSVSINPSHAVFYVSQSQLFDSIVTNGTPDYKYQWYLDGHAVSGATQPVWNLTLPSPGLHTVQVEVNDNVSAQAMSNTASVVCLIHGHDLTITNVTVEHPITNVAVGHLAVYKGMSVELYVIVSNLGNYTESFSVTASINGSSIRTQYINSSIAATPLSSGSSSTITFTWNTASYPYGNYTIGAYVTLAPGETNLANNIFIGSSVQITKVGNLGSRVYNATSGQYENEFGVFTGTIGPADLSLFLQCYHGTAPAQWMYLADLGSRVNGVNTFFVYSGGGVSPADLALFLECYHGLGPS
jgi:hypothetical protein